MRVECGPLTFISDFDSGNFLRAELVEPPTGENAVVPSSFNHQGIDYEVNIWTKPDAYGTRYQNGNRTWFYFAIKGGKSQGILKLNIISINKQVKLFEQGMQPVVRILPEWPMWDRVRDRITLKGKETCNVSFKQKLPNDPDNSTLFIAFTYPFSYSEMFEWLNKIDDLYSQGFFLPSPEPSKADLILHSRSATTANLHNTSMQNNIYYHRECVCLSLEGRRVELITISSVYGQSLEREEYLNNLFPYRNEPRPFKFPQKKVVFVSSRVHPGETPAQFVFNGFLRFLLEPKDPRAILLRKLFVFKLIPILNPDGVHAGHYRTDPRGVNLNRVYLRPSPVLHPSIYAARKLILYYHNGFDVPDDYEYENELDTTEVDGNGDSNLTTENSSADDSLEPSRNITPSSSEVNLKLRGNTLCAGCVTGKGNRKSLEENEAIFDPDNSAMSEFGVTSDMESLPAPGHMFVANEDSHQCTFESCDEDSIADIHDVRHRGSFCSFKMDTTESPLPVQSQSKSFISSLPKVENSKKIHPTRGNPKLKGKKSKDSETEVNSKSKRQVKSKRLSAKSVSSSEKELIREKHKGGEDQSGFSDLGADSGVYLYVDIHAHATKRGIFMYGNHFPDSQTQAECMLFPRLMAMNCQHFDFAACNFTERLMNLKDRRDGASREGSGRVAVLKLTGLVRSYTLECNYNTGRIVNRMQPRPLSYGFNEAPYNSVHPPKFTPDLFEQCGRAMAESLLDLTGNNPWSRLNFTEFRTLDGMKRFLLRRLSHSPEFCTKKKESNNTTPKKIFPSPQVPGSSTTSLIYGIQEINPSPNRKWSLNRQPLVPAIGPLVPKKENETNVLVSKPSSSKRSSKITKIFEKATTSSAAKIKHKLKPAQSESEPSGDGASKHGTSKVKVPQSSSLTQVFKSKKKAMKKKIKSVSASDIPKSKPKP